MPLANEGNRPRIIRAAATLIVSLSVLFSGVATRAQNADNEKKINDLIAQLTLEEVTTCFPWITC